MNLEGKKGTTSALENKRTSTPSINTFTLKEQTKYRRNYVVCYRSAKTFEGFTVPLMYGKPHSFGRRQFGAAVWSPPEGKGTLMPWQWSTTWPGWTTQGRRYNFSLSCYKTATDLQGFIIKQVFISTRAAQTPTGTSAPPLQPIHLMMKVCVLSPWQVCFQPREERAPLGKRASSPVLCHHLLQREQTWRGQPICLLSSVMLLSFCAKKEYRRGHIKYLQFQ